MERVVSQVSRSVTELTMTSCNFSKDCLDVFCKLVANENCRLLKLNMVQCKMYGVTGDALWDAIGLNKSIKWLMVSSGFHHFNQKHLSALSGNTCLKWLDLSKCHVSSEGLIALAGVIKDSRTLTTVKLSGNAIDAKGGEVLGEVLKINHVLETLDLSWNLMENDGVKHLAEGLKLNKTLTDLSVVGNSISSAGAVCDALKVNSSLLTLDLAYNQLQTMDCLLMRDALKCNGTLTSLALNNHNFGSEGLVALGEGIRRNQLKRLCAEEVGGDIGDFLGNLLLSCTSLTDIDLRGNSIQSCRLISEGLKANKTVKRLLLGENNVSMEELVLIFQGIQENITLTMLDMSAIEVGVQGARALSDALIVNQSLEELWIRSCELGAEGCCELARMLKVNRALKVMRLQSNKAKCVGGCAIFEALKLNRTLESLSLSANHLDRSCVASMCSMIQMNQTLTDLDVADNLFGPEGAPLIAQALSVNHSLTSIDAKDFGSAGRHHLIDNPNLLYANGFGFETKSMCALNLLRRDVRVEMSTVTLIAIRKRLKQVPKEVFIMIAKCLIKTIDDMRAWKV